MKNHYIILAFFLTVIFGNSFAQFGEIQNGDFESWTNQTLYESPTAWKSSNTEEYRGVAVTSKSTTAQEGSYSVLLETVALDDDTLVGYVFHGSLGATGPEGGIAYTSAFDAIRVQCQSNILMGDTLYMLLIRFSGGTLIDMEMLPVAEGVNSSWTQVDLPVNTMGQDEVFIGFIMGDPDVSPKPGSWALVDNVEMLNGGVATTPLPNQGFETWTTASVENADNWYTLNTLLSSFQMENSNKTTDAYSGTYAMAMTTVQAFGTDTVPAYISIGEIDLNAQGSPFLPAPYTATPTTFSGAYKYSPVNGDEAAIQVLFYQGGSIIGEHGEMFVTAQTSYQTFSSPLAIFGTPDSIVFLAFSGENPGSVLKLDDLQFSGGDVSIGEVVSNDLFTIYPNPANEVVTINLEANSSYSLYIYNVIGKLVDSKENSMGITELNVSDFPKGTYLIRIVSGNKIFTEKLIID